MINSKENRSEADLYQLLVQGKLDEVRYRELPILQLKAFKELSGQIPAIVMVQIVLAEKTSRDAVFLARLATFLSVVSIFLTCIFK